MHGVRLEFPKVFVRSEPSVHIIRELENYQRKTYKKLLAYLCNKGEIFLKETTPGVGDEKTRLRPTQGIINIEKINF